MATLLRACGAARAALPPLRESVPGFTGWTPYPALGPRGPSPCGPSLRSGNRPAAALSLRSSGPLSGASLAARLPDRSRGRGTIVPPRAGRRWGALHLAVYPAHGSPQKSTVRRGRPATPAAWPASPCGCRPSSRTVLIGGLDGPLSRRSRDVFLGRAVRAIFVCLMPWPCIAQDIVLSRTASPFRKPV